MKPVLQPIPIERLIPYPAYHYIFILLSSLLWNQCPVCRGMRVQFVPEFAFITQLAKVDVLLMDDWGVAMLQILHSRIFWKYSMTGITYIRLLLMKEPACVVFCR